MGKLVDRINHKVNGGDLEGNEFYFIIRLFFTKVKPKVCWFETVKKHELTLVKMILVSRQQDIEYIEFEMLALVFLIMFEMV